MNTPEAPKVKRGIGLQIKLVVGLLIVSLLPLAVSALLVGNIGEVAQNFASNHAAKLRPHLETSQAAYREVIAAKRGQFRENSKRLAQLSFLREETIDSSAFSQMVSEHALILSVEVLDEQSNRLAFASAPKSDKNDIESYRPLEVREAVAQAPQRTLMVVYAADLAPVKNLQASAEALAMSRRVDDVKSSLPDSYRTAFILLVGGVAIVVTAIALLFARTLTRRIGQLVVGARQVAKGDMQARVELEGKDEFGELAVAFNTMVGDLQEERQKTLYLQRIGAWQDVARKLAHEIKNPLTPIQLVVQQVVSKYEGSDERYKKLLGTCDEIVHEEIDGLRRLVDAFRDLGRLPKVMAAELAIEKIVGDLRTDPNLSEFVQFSGVEEGLSVSADRLLLKRSLVNLLDNGIQAGQEAGNEGKVHLSWTQKGEIVEFIIDDEGGGVPEDKREHIFDPYVTSKDTGTGLGLAIAKKVALDHRGSLRLSNQLSPTGGARFILEIPAA